MKYVTLCGKRDFTDVIKLKLLKWEDCPGLSKWAQCNHKDPCGGRVSGETTTLEAMMGPEKDLAGHGWLCRWKGPDCGGMWALPTG